MDFGPLFLQQLLSFWAIDLSQSGATVDCVKPRQEGN